MIRTARVPYLPIRCLAAFSATPVFTQGGAGAFANIDWNKPFPAHKIIGNIYFAGSVAGSVGLNAANLAGTPGYPAIRQVREDRASEVAV